LSPVLPAFKLGSKIQKVLRHYIVITLRHEIRLLIWAMLKGAFDKRRSKAEIGSRIQIVIMGRNQHALFGIKDNASAEPR
jgi:hypothetical protein